MIPSRPATCGSPRARPHRRPRGVGGTFHAGPSSSSPSSRSRRSLVRQPHQRLAVEVEQVEDHVGDRCSFAGRVIAERPLRCMRPCRRWKLGRPSSSIATISPSSTALREPSWRCSRFSSGKPDVIVAQRAGLEPQPARLGVGDRAHPVPLDLEHVLVLVGGQLGEASPSSAPRRRGRLGGHGRSMRWIIQSFASWPAWNSAYLPCTRLPESVRTIFLRLPLLDLVGAAVVHRHLAGAVAAFGDRALPGRGTRAGDPRCARPCGWSRGRSGRPRGRAKLDQHAVALEPQVEVPARRGVLLDREPRLPRRPLWPAPCPRGSEVLSKRRLRAVGGELVGHFLALARAFGLALRLLDVLRDSWRAAIRSGASSRSCGSGTVIFSPLPFFLMIFRSDAR